MCLFLFFFDEKFRKPMNKGIKKMAQWLNRMRETKTGKIEEEMQIMDSETAVCGVGENSLQ